MIISAKLKKLAKGEETYKESFIKDLNVNAVEYWYKSKSGKTFGTQAPTLKKCRALKDKWIEEGEKVGRFSVEE